MLGVRTLPASNLGLVKERAYAGTFIVLIGIVAAPGALRPESRHFSDAKVKAAAPNPGV